MRAQIRIILAGFILGALIGAAVLNWATGHHLDKAELEIKKLHATLADQSEKITVLEKKLAVKQSLTISEIRVYVDLEDEFEKLELESNIKKLLKELKGKELREIDPNLVISIVDKRIVETQEHKYRLSVKGTLVSERIIMYVEANEIKEVPLTKMGDGESGEALHRFSAPRRRNLTLLLAKSQTKPPIPRPWLSGGSAIRGSGL